MPSAGRLRYVEVPAGRGARRRGTLVLVHGFPLTPSMWEPQFGIAEQGWRIIAPELRGFGNGSGDPPTTSIDDYAGDIIDLLDALHIGEAVICGLSMGGYTALAMFRHAPNYFQALVLADTRAEGDSPEAVTARRSMQQLVREKGPAAVADALLPRLVGETTKHDRPQVVEHLRRQITGNSKPSIEGALTALMTRPDSTPTLATIHCPVQIIVGEEDVLTPPALSEQMHRAIPGSEITVIGGAGHMSNMEQPQLFNEALARFLQHRV
jgi:pimeloyl-ACP methyl ester carboxylesterase